MAIDPKLLPWNRLGMAEQDWRALSRAFYSVAHNDFKEFEALPEALKLHQVGRLCTEYIKTRDRELVEEAGRALTFTKNWYTYLGR